MSFLGISRKGELKVSTAEERSRIIEGEIHYSVICSECCKIDPRCRLNQEEFIFMGGNGTLFMVPIGGSCPTQTSTSILDRLMSLPSKHLI